jgi:hypothetical protein
MKWIWPFLLFSLLFVGCSNKKGAPLKREVKTGYVDSVWKKDPGEMNTLQFDPVYFFRTTEGKTHRSRVPVSIGDSFIYVFYTHK